MMKIAIAVAAFAALIGTPAFAADLPVKAPPLPPAPAYSWTGFYGGLNAGFGWTNNAVNLSANDPVSAAFLAGTVGTSEQPLPGSYNLSPNSAVGGLQGGYNWQAGPNWLLGFEADYTFAHFNAQATGSAIQNSARGENQTANVQQTTDGYGTVRGRLGWLATPSLLIFGTGGLAYGRTSESANYALTGPGGFTFFNNGGFSANCADNSPCMTGASTVTHAGWTVGGGAEWMFYPHLSLKAEYQFVDLGTQTVTFTALAFGGGRIPSSFNATFRDEIQVVRAGLNWHL